MAASRVGSPMLPPTNSRASSRAWIRRADQRGSDVDHPRREWARDYGPCFMREYARGPVKTTLRNDPGCLLTQYPECYPIGGDGVEGGGDIMENPDVSIHD